MKYSRSCFLHMPKCGGTSVRLALEKLLGVERLRLDYGGVPGISDVDRHERLLGYVDNPVSIEPGCCIYGHFRPVKYLGAAGSLTDDILVFTILREPVDRLVSHYRYLLALNESNNPMRAALKEHHDDFAWFAMQPRLRNLYARHLYQVPVSRVTYFGVYEHLDKAWFQIASLLRPDHIPIPLPKVNTTAKRASVVIPRPGISNLLRTDLEDLHTEDEGLRTIVG